ncbi:MAG: hypothetical protein HQ517_06520, partial [SAR324 cluster bacterium]|nr:hypothetical protein [SAR324 cluster bacterium]
RDIGVYRREFVTDYDTDSVRYSLSDNQKLTELKKELPIFVTSAVKKAVKEFGSDTPGLLNNVYLTRPMLLAAPKEKLDFTPEEVEPLEERTPAVTPAKLSTKEKKIKEKKFNDIKARLRAKLEENRQKKKRRYVVVEPRYDDIYFEGVKWLNSLAGPPIEDIEGELDISDEIWKMRGRADELS